MRPQQGKRRRTKAKKWRQKDGNLKRKEPMENEVPAKEWQGEKPSFDDPKAYAGASVFASESA